MMSKPILTVTIVEGPDISREADTIRMILEEFNVRVLKYTIGRPFDFINFLNGNDNPLKSDFVVLCFHGVDGRFLMPKLHDSIYEDDEPKNNFGPEDILKYSKLTDISIINTGCALGYEEMALSFLKKGCNAYIGVIDDVEGNSVLFFVVRFFYEICTNNKSYEEAFDLAISTDNELGLFRLYNRF